MESGFRQGGDQAAVQLAGAKILILEDQFDVADLLEAAVRDAGGEVPAIAASIDDALKMIREIPFTAAIITMIADGIYTDLVARELLRRGVPFVVTTGIGTDPRHPELHAAPTIIKPFQASHVQALLAERIASAGEKPAG